MATSLAQIKKKTTPIFKENDIEYAGLFGSHIHGTARSDSDVDILIRFSKPKSLFDLIGLQQELSKRLDKKVDLVTERALSKYFRDEVIKEAQTIYEKR